MLFFYLFEDLIRETPGSKWLKTEIGNSATHQPDLLLIEVQMPELDGFSVWRMIELKMLPLVVFVTAYDECAVEAFEISTVYLLKSIRCRLKQAAREKPAFR